MSNQLLYVFILQSLTNPVNRTDVYTNNTHVGGGGVYANNTNIGGQNSF